MRPLRRDIHADPLLRYVLLLAVVSFGFGIWFRVPNFAGPDEYSRLIQPMKVAGRVVADPSFGSLQGAVTDGRTLGATFYLYAFVLAPIFVAILLTGQLGQFVSLGGIASRWTLWHEAPAWFWTSAVLLGRVVSLLLGLACIYLVYRLGVRIHDRWTGQVAAVGLALSFGFVESAHTINEDIPMVFFLLSTVLLCVRYIESGRRRTFLLACFTAGTAVAFKLTGGSAVVAVGASYLLRAFRAEDRRAALIRPKMLTAGLVVGLVTILLGFPSVLVGGPGELLTRVTHTTGQKTTLPGGIVAGIEFWLLRGYLSSFGLALFLGVLVGVAETGRNLLRRTDGFDERVLLVATPIVVTLAVFSAWRYVRVHHLLPTLPLLLVLGALGMRRLWDDWERGVRVGLALLFVTSAVYTGVGDLRLATDPRDEATDWIQTNADAEDTVEVYENSIADVAAVHGRPVAHYDYPEENATYNSSLVLNEWAYTEWMVSMPERRPAYIQLTAEELHYITDGYPDAEQYPRRRAYVEGLLSGEYNYTVVETYGERPTSQSLGQQLFQAGVEPTPEIQEPYVVILARENETAADGQR
ncbi:ArnT family glycosyltransferase [Haloarcula amylovorans]|uniref:ArnT family glycosyltransferase n=1 Tax=Haloarcula amylovorans TaxID=2562280 RepID=UPI001076965F|nr:glycosyltransferase family 39 protein [Halomicroarcula amylolytica]